MREVKYKYYFKNKSTGRIASIVRSLEDIEEEGLYIDIGHRYGAYIGRCQFTGLFDKNGVEIYQHDICTDGYGDKVRVKYMHYGFYPFISILGAEKEHSPEYFEVVGNVFEEFADENIVPLEDK